MASSAIGDSALNREAAASDVRNFKRQRLAFCQPDVVDDEPYEAGIARTGRVPTRSNLHDFFNALIFLHFPKAKARLNQLQVSGDHARRCAGGTRTHA